MAEVVGLLAALAPDLSAALRVAAGKAYVILDGTLLAIDRVGMRAKTDRLYYSGKHKPHGLNVQVLSDPVGRLVWASPTVPGSTHDLTAARTHGLLGGLADAQVMVLADRGYQGARGTVRVRGQHRPRPTARTRRTRRGHPEELAPAAQDPRLPQRGANLVAAILTLETATRS